ncbi:hypothetical protein AWT69_001238 [Pseudomonas putida]|nr:hypothetical protein AWT69_001238 [Pseudomonas putida]
MGRPPFRPLARWPGRGGVMHAHTPARAYRLRDRLRNKGQ